MADTYTWDELNAKLRTVDEKECERLLRAERAGKARTQYLLRIYGRFNVLRTERERREMLTPAKGKAK